MVLMMVRRKARLRERRPKTFKGELESNSRKTRTLVRKLAMSLKEPGFSFSG
jgi:hypothetical protein